MPKPNHICKNPKCGKAYYACESCEKIGSWKALACSPACFQAYVKSIDVKNEVVPSESDSEKSETVLETPKSKIRHRSKKDIKQTDKPVVETAEE